MKGFCLQVNNAYPDFTKSQVRYGIVFALFSFGAAGVIKIS